MTVDVIMPAWNAERFIGEAIRSVLDQGDILQNLWVVDDESDDRTIEVAIDAGGDDPRCHVIAASRHGGSASMRNLGLGYGTAPYVNFFDADDVMCAEALSATVRMLHDHPDAPGVYGKIARVFDQIRGVSLGSYLYDRHRIWGQLGYEDLALRDRRPYGYTCFVYRREVIQKIGGYDPTLELAEDFDLLLRVTKQGGPVLFCDVPFFVYRIHENNKASRIVDGKLAAAPGGDAWMHVVLAKHGLAK